MPLVASLTRIFVIVTPRPFWAWLGMVLGLAAALTLAGALLSYRAVVLGWLQLPLFLVVGGAGIVVGMRLGRRREAVGWLGDALSIQPLGWERHLRSARQIAREQVQSYLYEWAYGPRLRLRLQSGEKIVFGPGDYWRWNHHDEQAFVDEALQWLEAAPARAAPRREPAFWERPAATLVMILLTIVVLGGTGWGVLHGLAPGKSWWQLVPVYTVYLAAVLSWRRARRGKTAG